MSAKKRKSGDLLEKRRSVPERLFFILMTTVLVAWSVLFILMIIWTLINALKTNVEYVMNPLGFPEKLQFGNFKLAVQTLNHNGVGFFGMLYNSLWFSLGYTLISTFTVVTAGYILAHYRFKGRNFLYALILFIMIIPIYGNLPATYKLYYSLGINDSYLFLITAFSAFNANTLLTYGYYKSVPKEFREAIYIDGGNDFTAYFRVYLPLGRNIFIAIFLLGVIGVWNNYETPILYFDRMPNLASGLYYFQQEIQYASNTPAYFCGALLVSLPTVLLFSVFSNRIMGQLYSGGLKG